MIDEITITDEHLKLLQRMYIRWEDGEYGAPAVDCKRPYGNSDVAADIYEILGWRCDDPDGPSYSDSAARTIHQEMQHVLQILVQHPTTGINVGRWRRTSSYGSEWERVV